MNNTLVAEQQKLQQETQGRYARKIQDYPQISLYKDINPLDWEDWHWQLKNRIRTKDALAQIIKLTPEEEIGISIGYTKII